jgi:hypothetical protein
VDGMWIRKGNKGMNMIQVHYLHVWDGTHYFGQLIYAN